MKLSVLIPVFDEAPTLREVLDRVLAAPVNLELELICVDDKSNDDSLAILSEAAARDSRIKVIAQPMNQGKGSAVRRAIEHMSGDIAIIQDADLEYDPADYPALLKPLLEGSADVVYGSRFVSGTVNQSALSWHTLGNKFLTLLSNVLNGLRLTDMETCYKAMRADLLKSLHLTSDRFGFEPELTARLAQAGASIVEVPISYDRRSYDAGKKIGWRDGVEAIWLIFKFRFFDRQI